MELNSCLMWATGLYTPINLQAIFDKEDLKDTGIELDSHITLLYAQGKNIPHESLLSDIKTILGSDWQAFEDRSKELDNSVPVLDLFELSYFENDSDYLILKLKENTDMFKWTSVINKGLRLKYDVKSNFDKFTPHMTLAELKPGTLDKYLSSTTLELVLGDTLVDFEDLMISYGTDNDVEDRKQYFLTQYKNVDRFFRINSLKKETID